MKQQKILAVLILSLICLATSAQDERTLETKVADLLVQMPASSFEYRDKLADETYSLGSDGLIKICSMVIPPGTGDDTQARFAIESLSKYLSKEKPSHKTKEWEAICIPFATHSNDMYVQAFFIRQLQWIGSSASIDALSPFLSDDFLCNPAISAMKQADPQRAGVVFASVAGSLPDQQKTETVKAIGDLKVIDANNLLIDMLAQDNKTDLQRNILIALASIGSPDSHKPLSNAAKASGYKSDPESATMALLEYAGELGTNGNRELSNRICLRIMKKCKAASQAHFKSYALAIYADNVGLEDAMPMLVKAMKDDHKAYRMSIIHYAIDKSSPADPWVKELAITKDPEIQSEIIFLLGALEDKTTLSTLIKFLDNPQAGVRSEAVGAIASIEGSSAVDEIVSHMFKYPAAPDLTAAKSALLSIANSEDLKPFIHKIPGAPDPVKVVFIELLAEKGSPEFFGMLMANARSESKDVSYAAIRGLQRVATDNNLTTLLDFLSEDHDDLSTVEIQKAIISSVNSSDNKKKHVDMVLSGMGKAEDKTTYIPVLAGIGGEKSLNSVKDLYDHSNGESKELALKALVNWSDGTVIPILADICKNTGSEPAFRGYVQQVDKSKHFPEQKLLLLRKIMPYATNIDQKNSVITACGSIKTFLSLLFVSGYLEEVQLTQSAAHATVKIALPTSGKDDGLYGENVRSVLTTAKEIISGPESPYIKIDVETYLKAMSHEQGFVPIFNGKDLSGWQGLVENPIARAKMDKRELAEKQAGANELMLTNWKVQNGTLVFMGTGYDNICTIKEYGDFEMIVDWRINKKGDSGIYLRGSPQIQIWDPSREESGPQVGSGGLFNNQENPSKPLLVADNIIPDWNSFRLTMIGERVTVYLNGNLVVNNVVLENYWDRSIPIFPSGPIELQAHGNDIAFRDVYVREIHGTELSPEEKAEGFVLLFNGKNLDGWTGNKINHVIEDGTIAIRPELGGHGNLYTEKEYTNFNFRLEFKLTPGANNGLGIRTPLEGNAAYLGMEFQVLDNTAPVYANLEPYQYHGSVYGVIPARRGFLRPVGEWNEQEVIVDGTKIKIVLNGTTIVDGDIADSISNGTLDGKDHPGLKRKTGHIGFLGHGSVLWFRNIRIKDLDSE